MFYHCCGNWGHCTAVNTVTSIMVVVRVGIELSILAFGVQLPHHVTIVLSKCDEVVITFQKTGIHFI